MGFLEKIYENALAIEMTKNGLKATQQKAMVIRYDNLVVGDYIADFIVEGKVILEVKAVKSLDQIHTAQCLNYLRANGLPLALLLNFGTPRIQIKRIAGAFIGK